MNTKRNKSALSQLETIAGKSLSLGSLLEALRQNEEMTLAEFALQLKISSSHLCDIEKGRKVVTPERAANFAQLLGRSERQFIRLAIQDNLNRLGLKFKVQLEVA